MTYLEFDKLYNILNALPAEQTFRNNLDQRSYKLVRYQEEDYLITFFHKNAKRNKKIITIGYYSQEQNDEIKQININQKSFFNPHSPKNPAYMVRFYKADAVSVFYYYHGHSVEQSELKQRVNKSELKDKLAKL